MGTNRAKYFPAPWNAAVKTCDFCATADAVVFRSADAAFMCVACDAKPQNNAEKHERVWMCEVCEHAPAAVTCKADAATLCVACDRDIHSANPLAGRHERLPVVPFYNAAETMLLKSTAAAVSFLVPAAAAERVFADSTPADNQAMKSVEFLLSDSDQFLEFDNYQFCCQPYCDSVVPVQTNVKPPPPYSQLNHQTSLEKRLEIDFTKSNITSYANSHSFSSSSMEVGVVPDGGAMPEISHPFAKLTNTTAERIGNQGPPVVGTDRVARVLRYREKRKNRKFEKTIRYASRKAYAEIRPRVKGRFAKRTDPELDTDDGVFSYVGAGNFAADSRYGVVPSF